MKVALFVEGGSAPVATRREPPLRKIWDRLTEALGIEAFALLVPISKKNIVAMDPDEPRISGAGEGLDQLMARHLRQTSFDAAIVAWDLIPAWDPDARPCRWQETLGLYRLLGQSADLPEPWVAAARRRHRQLADRPRPSQRARPHRLAPHEVVAVCMDPMFESLLLQREQHVFRAVGVGRRPKGWPTQGYGQVSRPDAEILVPLVNALRSGPRKQWPPIAKTIRADARYDKDPWLEHLLRRLLDDPEARALVLEHPICLRLRECLAAP